MTHAIAYVIRYCTADGEHVRRGACEGTEPPAQMVRRIRAAVMVREGLDALPAIAWSPSAPYRAHADASDLPVPRSHAEIDPFQVRP